MRRVAVNHSSSGIQTVRKRTERKKFTLWCKVSTFFVKSIGARLTALLISSAVHPRGPVPTVAYAQLIATQPTSDNIVHVYHGYQCSCQHR